MRSKESPFTSSPLGSTVAAFSMMFGLVGLDMLYYTNYGNILSFIFAIISGIFMAFISAKLIKLLYSLSWSGNDRPTSALFNTGTVYLTIPVNGKGEIEVEVNGRLRVCDAISANNQELKTGEKIKVVNVDKDGVMTVEKEITENPTTDKDEITEAISIDDNVVAADKTVETQVKSRSESSRVPTGNNPNIPDDTTFEDEVSADIKLGVNEAVAKEAMDESSQQIIQDAIAEVMQATLSNENLNAQQSDTNKDSRRKMFTRFEQQKQAAIRKAVQRISKVRDAR